MRKFIFRSHERNIITTFLADNAFWMKGSGAVVVLIKGESMVAAIGLMPGDILVEDGSWKDLPSGDAGAAGVDGMSKLVN